MVFNFFIHTENSMLFNWELEYRFKLSKLTISLIPIKNISVSKDPKF